MVSSVQQSLRNREQNKPCSTIPVTGIKILDVNPFHKHVNWHCCSKRGAQLLLVSGGKEKEMYVYLVKQTKVPFSNYYSDQQIMSCVAMGEATVEKSLSWINSLPSPVGRSQSWRWSPPEYRFGGHFSIHIQISQHAAAQNVMTCLR